MRFPDVPRVIYGENPLSEVVCQVRFPRLLLLDERVPVAFQKEVGDSFPNVETRETSNVVVSGGGIPLPNIDRRIIYDFKSQSGDFVVSLCSDFIAFRSTEYRRWEDFFAQVKLGVESLYRCYSIKYISRVGLRYVNLIDRRRLGLDGHYWRDLVRESMLGLLADPDIETKAIAGFGAATKLDLEVGSVVINSGLHSESDTENPKFVMDCDFFLEGPTGNLHDAYKLLEDYNKSARNAFRWFIEEPLHQALKPRELA